MSGPVFLDTPHIGVRQAVAVRIDPEGLRVRVEASQALFGRQPEEAVMVFIHGFDPSGSDALSIAGLWKIVPKRSGVRVKTTQDSLDIADPNIAGTVSEHRGHPIGGRRLRIIADYI